MDQVTQQNAAMVEESTAASHSLAQEAAELGRLLSRFQIGKGAVTPLRAPQAAGSATVTAMRTIGGRGMSAALKPQADSWEEF